MFEVYKYWYWKDEEELIASFESEAEADAYVEKLEEEAGGRAEEGWYVIEI